MWSGLVDGGSQACTGRDTRMNYSTHPFDFPCPEQDIKRLECMFSKSDTPPFFSSKSSNGSKVFAASGTTLAVSVNLDGRIFEQRALRSKAEQGTSHRKL